MLNLGVIHLEPNGFGPDRALALHWLLGAAWLGQGDAQALLRRLGHTGPFPPAVDHGLRMRPAPEGATGHSSLCGEPIA
jgi:hypothetical protein